MHGQQIVYTICVSFYNLMGYCRVCELFTWMNLVTIQLGYHMSSTLPAADLQVIFGAPAAADPWTIPNMGGIYIRISLCSLHFLPAFIWYAIWIFFLKEKMLAVFSQIGFEIRSEKQERTAVSIVLPLRSLQALLVPKVGKTGYRRDRGLDWDLIYTRWSRVAIRPQCILLAPYEEKRRIWQKRPLQGYSLCPNGKEYITTKVSLDSSTTPPPPTLFIS